MNFLGRNIKAAIFDLDGTLIDSTEVWDRVDAQFFVARNMDIPEDYSKKIAHIGLDEAAIFTKETYGIKESIEEILDEWYRLSKKQYEEEIELKPYTIELLEYLKKNGVKLSIATANTKDLYMPCLKRLKIYDYFDVIVDVDETKVGKNDAALYNTTIARLNVRPEETVVFEDIPVGLKTAYNNNYLTIAVYDKHSISETYNKKKYSHLFIDNFMEFIDYAKREN